MECQKPPLGWTCSRYAGHDGPCAASPIVPTGMLTAIPEVLMHLYGLMETVRNKRPDLFSDYRISYERRSDLEYFSIQVRYDGTMHELRKVPSRHDSWQPGIAQAFAFNLVEELIPEIIKQYG